MSNLSPKKIKKLLILHADEFFGKYPVLFAYLYGSFAGERVHAFSDIDIAISVEDVPPEKKLELELTLSIEIDEKLSCSAKSEVRIINALPLIIKGKIICEGILIYTLNDIERVNFETSVRSAYFDFFPVIDEYQRVFFENS